MNMTKPPASVLTHGGDSKSAILSTIGSHTEHMVAQHETHMKTLGEPVNRRHMHYDDVPAGWDADSNKVLESFDEPESEPATEV